MSPSLTMPKIESVMACKTTSASECPYSFLEYFIFIPPSLRVLVGFGENL